MKRTPTSVATLESLGGERLSASFFMRDFLYSEIANFHGLQNIPKNPELALQNGKRLCQDLLEPLQATFGRIAIRSAYRSEDVNEFGNIHKMNCGSNESNYAGHIWDVPNKNGMGAMACIVVPRFADLYDEGKGRDWRALAYWIHNHLPYSTLQFFPKLCGLNIGWHEKPRRSITGYMGTSIDLVAGSPPNDAYATWYEGLPELKGVSVLIAAEN